MAYRLLLNCARAATLLALAVVAVLFGAAMFRGYRYGKPSQAATPSSTVRVARSLADEMPAATTYDQSTQLVNVLMNAAVLQARLSKGGFGSVLIADFTVQNPTDFGFKDFEITCTSYGPSGTAIDSNTRTIYRTVPPRSTTVARGINMGFIRDQASTSTCEITGLIPAPGTPISRRQRPRHAAPAAPPVAEIKEAAPTP